MPYYDIPTVTVAGQRFVVVPENEYRDLRERAGGLGGASEEPPLPQPNADGNYPAVESARVLLARKVLHRRRALNLSQAELARRPGVRVETVNRLEGGTHSSSITAVDKIVRALDQAESANR